MHTSSWKHRYRPLLERLFIFAALLGVLVVVHLHIQQGRGFDRGCLGFSSPESVEKTFNCELVTSSSAGRFLGVSNAFWGLLFYGGLVAASLCVALSSAQPRSLLKVARVGLVGGGLAYSLYLSYVQYFVLKDLCALCLISAGIVTVLSLIVILDVLGKEKATDQTGPVRKVLPVYGAAIVLVAALVALDFWYFGGLEKATQATTFDDTPPADLFVEGPWDASVPVGELEGQCGYDPQKKVVNLSALVDATDPSQGPSDAPVTMVEFFDPNCPHCKSMYETLKPIVEAHQEYLRIVYKPVALPQFRMSGGQNTVLFAAFEAGKFREMLDLQFENQSPEGLGLEELKGYAEYLGMDAEGMAQRIVNNEYTDRVNKRNMQAYHIGVNLVPTLLINGYFVAQDSKTPDCLNTLIAHELSQATTAE